MAVLHFDESTLEDNTLYIEQGEESGDAYLLDAEGALRIVSQSGSSYFNNAIILNNPDRIHISLSGSTPVGETYSVTVSDSTNIELTLGVEVVPSSGGGDEGSTIYDLVLETYSISFSAKGNTNASQSIGYKVMSSGNGGGSWIECSDPSGISVSTASEYVTVTSDNQSLGGWQGHIIVTRTSRDYNNDTTDEQTSASAQSITFTGASAELDIWITHVEYNYKIQIDSYPTPSAYNSTITTNNFKVYKYKNSTLNSTYQKESNTDYAGSCTWTPSLPYTGSNTNGESKTFQASLTGSGYDPDSVTIVFPAKAEDPYITLDGESSYEESLNRIGNREGESTNASLSVATNLSSWGVNASTNASTVSSYGITVQKSGSSVTVNGTSTYGGQNGSSITGIWTVGNSSTYATIEITLTYENEQPVTTYTYRMTLTPSSLTYNNDDFSSRRVYFDIERKANGTSNWIPYDTDSVTATAPSGFSVSVDNQSLSGHHGYADITRIYNGTSLYETSISFDTGGDNPASEELNITVNAQEQVNYDERWVYDGNPSFTEYTYNCSSSQDSHTVGSISGSYTIKKQLAPAGTNNWTDTSPLVTDTKSFSNGSLTTSFTAYRSDATGTPLTVSTSKTATVTDPSVGSAATGSVDIVITFDDPNVDYEYKVEISLDTGYGSLTVSPGTTITPSWFNVLWYKREVGTSSWGNSIINRYDYATYVPDLNYTVPSNAQNGSTFDIEISDNYYSPLAQGYENNETITFTVYVAPLEYNLVCTNPSSSSITLPYGSSVSKSDFTFKLTYGGSDVETGILGNSNSLSWSGNGPSLPWTNNYSYSGSHNYSVTYNTYSVSTTVTIFFEPEDTPPPQDTYSLSVSPTSVTLNSSNSYSSSVTADTYTNNVRTNWGSSLSFSDVDTSKITVTKGSYNSGSGTPFTISKASSCNSSTTTSFTISGHEQSTTVLVTITIPAPQATITWRATDDTTILNLKYFYYDFTPSGSPKGTLTFSNSYAEEGQHVLFNNYGWVAIRNENTTSQTRTTVVTVTHGSNSNATSQLTVTLPPPGFSINVPYPYDNPCAYTGYGYGHVVVQGAKNEAFALTLDNTNAGDGFTYSFSSSSVVTTYSGNTGSSGSVEVPTYEITKNQNTGDDYGYAMITAVGTPNTRTDTVTIHRVHLSTELSMMASPNLFTSTGGTCSLTIYSIGYDNTSFEIIGYSDTAAMIQNHTSYVDGTRRSSLRLTILENDSTSTRKVTINCLMRGTKEGDDYESEITRTATIRQIGRGLEEKIILTPSSLTFQPTDNGNSKKQQVIVNSGDYNWTVSSDKTWWDYDVTSGTSGSAIYIWPTSEAPADTTRSGSITFTSTGGSNITGTLTILQTANSRILGFGHATDTTQGWDIADADFTGVSTRAAGGWDYNSSTRTLTINIPAESTRQDLTVRAVYKIISRFIGWDMTIQGEQPDWLRVSPNKLLYNESSTNSIATSINVIADDYNYQADPSCYDVPRSATYVINSNLKKN